MDVIRGDFGFDFKSGQVSGKVGAKQPLDPEIANEGQKVLLSDGEEVSWTPPAAKPVIPDWSEIKSIKRYFHKTGYQAFPAWFYGPNGEERLFRNREEADKEGIFYRKTTFEEKGQFGRDFTWDKKPGCTWSPIPYPGTKKFDPNNVGAGKNYIATPVNPRVAQNELLAELIPTVVAAVTTALKGQPGVQAPAHIDPKEWDAFLAFQAFKKTQEVLEPANEQDMAFDPPGSNIRRDDDDERTEWLAKAKEAGIKIDGRWKLEKLQKHVIKELEKRVRAVEQANEAPEAV